MVKGLVGLVEGIVDDFLEGVDPDEKIFVGAESAVGLRRDLRQVIEGAIADWTLTKEKEVAGHDAN